MLYPSLGFIPTSDKYRDSFDKVFRCLPARKGGFMITASGIAYYPCDPRAEDIRIEDIARHLAKICRFTGACSRHYSVAEHSVAVSRMVPREHALTGLLHDAPEAYINDLNRPTKHGPNMEGYREIEELNWQIIARKYGLPADMPEEVMTADAHMLFHEHAAIMPPVPEGLEWGMGLPKPDLIRPDLIRGWSWQDAERFFLNRYKELTA